MLDAWERIGREDAKRTPQPRATPNHTGTFTPLGLACLIRYRRGFEDEAAYIKGQDELAVERLKRSPGDVSTRRRRARPPAGHGHAKRRGKR